MARLDYLPVDINICAICADYSLERDFSLTNCLDDLLLFPLHCTFVNNDEFGSNCSPENSLTVNNFLCLTTQFVWWWEERLPSLFFFPNCWCLLKYIFGWCLLAVRCWKVQTCAKNWLGAEWTPIWVQQQEQEHQFSQSLNHFIAVHFRKSVCGANLCTFCTYHITIISEVTQYSVSHCISVGNRSPGHVFPRPPCVST